MSKVNNVTSKLYGISLTRLGDRCETVAEWARREKRRVLIEAVKEVAGCVLCAAIFVAVFVVWLIAEGIVTR